MKENILITGASGKVGREVVGRLHDRRARFVAASHHDSMFAPDVRCLKMDLGARSLVYESMKDVDLLFLNLPISESMVVYAQNAIMAAKNSGVKFMILTSILGADPESRFLLQETYGAIEHMAKDSRIPVVILRPNVYMQTFVTRHADSIRQGALFLPESEAKSSFVDIRDVADVAIKVIENPWLYEGRTISLTGPEALSNEDALQKIGRAIGRRVTYVPVTEAATRHRLLREGHSSWLVDAYLSIHRSAREGMTSTVHPSNQQVRGVEPRSFDDFCIESSAVWSSPYSESLREANF
ncbi:NmrA family NAD(P)-binding protein [Bdellovibrio sp. SKB1291214]|uniref:NmrA family NAD(P)-binding protein n=1 Tax=Bdellovibrio sp. SKB1291214 TaxID=1732569 RepID=UPI0015952705|nr:NmrA family NAD(P)-binding protein [Bdellovibrio sp. SKB1291214]UYL08197.1 NmrA family NAD(P)-binding protein [Bdellovibrio sp. SKB1291214]